MRAASTNVSGRCSIRGCAATELVRVNINATIVGRIIILCNRNRTGRAQQHFRPCKRSAFRPLPFFETRISPSPQNEAAGASAIQPRHRADRRARAAFDLDRKTNEAEATLADELVEIDQSLDMGEAHVAADVMHLE